MNDNCPNAMTLHPSLRLPEDQRDASGFLYRNDGEEGPWRVTECCHASVTYHDAYLCCKCCWAEVDEAYMERARFEEDPIIVSQPIRVELADPEPKIIAVDLNLPQPKTKAEARVRAAGFLAEMLLETSDLYDGLEVFHGVLPKALWVDLCEALEICPIHVCDGEICRDDQDDCPLGRAG